MTKILNDTWVLVADGENALFLVNKTDAADPHFVVRREEHRENPAPREQGDSAPGRLHDGPSVHRSSVQETDWHRLEKDRFSDEMAKMLYDYAHRGAFDRLVIVAPPRTLGELRDKLHSEVSDRVIGEIGKTLTNHPIQDIERIVKDEIDIAG